MLENNIDFWKLWLLWLLSRRKLELHALMAKLYIHKMDKKTFTAAAYYFQDDDNSRAFIFAK